MLSIRKRGEGYYIRGTVRVGNQTITVKERSTGFTKRKDAERYAAKLTAEIQEETLNPNADRSDRTTFDDCLRNYLDKKRVKIGELKKINTILPYFEGVKVVNIRDSWNKYCADKSHIKLATLNRYADVVNAILRSAETDLNITAPVIKKNPVVNKVVFMLTADTREKLLSCYSERTQPIFEIYSLQGFREQELLQLQWQDVHFDTNTIVIRTSKNGETRTAPMHTRTRDILILQWNKAKMPSTGHVFLSQKRKPYTDTRKTGGGSPIHKAHSNALKRLKERFGIDLKMRVHDWRHDWAARMVMAGNDLLTVQKLGGWKTLSMVSRYATFSREHENNAINRI